MRRFTPLLLALITVSVAGCGTAPSAPTVPTTVPAADPTTTSAEGGAPAGAMAQCRARPAPNGDILVREIEPGLPIKALLLGRGWAWNYGTGECQTSTDFTISGASQTPGACTQIALASDNPGYNADEQPARPLKKITASVCH